MTQVIFQPVSNSIAQKNLSRTVYQSVPLDEVQQRIDSKTSDLLSELHPNQEVHFWGVASAGAAKQWIKLHPGDFVLFADSRGAFLSAWVTLCVESSNLGSWAWESDPTVGIFSYIYFLHDLKFLNPPIEKKAINVLIDNSENDAWMSFRVNDQRKSGIVLDYLSVDSTDGIPVTRREYERSIKFSGQETDMEAKSMRRKEQPFLRRGLFEGKSHDNCAICGNKFPIEFLVAAHIKKRSMCSFEERLDVPAIVAPMCRFGCDELYERGHLSVVDGFIKVKVHDAHSPVISSYLKRLEGKRCKSWDRSRVYYSWHAAAFGYI